jgi:hypothetical protein
LAQGVIPWGPSAIQPSIGRQHTVPLDLFGTIKMTAVAAIAGVTFASPIALKSDALAQIGHRLNGDNGHQVATETISAGGFTFDMPSSWGRVSGTSLASDSNSAAAGTMLSAGSAGASCKQDVQVSFIGYRGGTGHKLPLGSSISDTFSKELKVRLPGFKLVSTAPAATANGTRWQRYEFTYTTKTGPHREVLGAYRHSDGSGVVVVATGPDKQLAPHEQAIGDFLHRATTDTDAAS